MDYEKLSASMSALVEEFEFQGTAMMTAGPRAVPLASDDPTALPTVFAYIRCDPEAMIAPMSGVKMQSRRGTVRTALVSLLLQGDPALTANSVKAELQAHSRIPGIASGTFDPQGGFESVNYQKLDASLSAIVSDRPLSNEPNLKVSVRILAPPDPQQQKELESLGIYGVSPKGRVFSAQLSSNALSELSEKPWVRLLSLAQELKPLG